MKLLRSFFPRLEKLDSTPDMPTWPRPPPILWFWRPLYPGQVGVDQEVVGGQKVTKGWLCDRCQEECAKKHSDAEINCLFDGSP
jgi:hypothetical protein